MPTTCVICTASVYNSRYDKWRKMHYLSGLVIIEDVIDVFRDVIWRVLVILVNVNEVESGAQINNLSVEEKFEIDQQEYQALPDDMVQCNTSQRAIFANSSKNS